MSPTPWATYCGVLCGGLRGIYGSFHNRFKPKEMMISSLEYVEKTVPDVIVEGNADQGKVKVTVGNKVQTFDISHVDSLWKMSFTLKDVFDFIQHNTGADAKTATREVKQVAHMPGLAAADVIGLDQITTLRDAYRATHPDDFTLHSFHDEMLAAGSIPASLTQQLICSSSTRAHVAGAGRRATAN